MSSFLLKKKHMREALFLYFNLKKSAAESHRKLVETYGDNALSETTCRDWFRRFNACRAIGVSQAAISMRLHAMGKVQKIGKWIPHEMNDKQMERRQNTCQILLARQKKSHSCIGL